MNMHDLKVLLSTMRPKRLVTLAASIGGVMLLSSAASAATVFEWNEGGAGNGTFQSDPNTPAPNIPLISFHNATGPVLADDFISAGTGSVDSVTWWGSAAQSNTWEITFHNDSAFQPAFPYLSQHFVNATGVDPDGDGVFEFTAAWNPMDAFVTAGSQYWFSVANAANGWEWALAGPGGPQIGSQNQFALESVGGVPSVVAGPHDGPWSLPSCPVCGAQVTANLAFKISAVPLPAGLPLLATGVFGMLGLSRRRKTKA